MGGRRRKATRRTPPISPAPPATPPADDAWPFGATIMEILPGAGLSRSRDEEYLEAVFAGFVPSERLKSLSPPKPVAWILEWVLPLHPRTPGRAFFAYQKTLRKKIREGEPVPHRVFYSDGTSRIEDRVATKRPVLRKPAGGAPKKVTTAQVREHVSRYPDLSPAQRAQMLKKELGLKTLSRGTVSARLRALGYVRPRKK